MNLLMRMAEAGGTSERAAPEETGGAPGRPVIEVAAGLVFRDGLLLIAQRRPGDHLGGFWEFPGGKRELGETYEACLRRELREELAFEVEPREHLFSVTHAYPEKTVHLRFYWCSCIGGEPQPIGCGALAWVRPQDLNAYSFPAADEKLLKWLQTRPHLWASPVRPSE